MARVDNQEFFFNKADITAHESQSAPQTVIMAADGEPIALPDASYIRQADLTRDGQDLVLNGPDGSIRIEGYFSAADAPDLAAPDGATLTPDLVNSFAKSILKYADAGSMTDESPVGAIQEMSGEVTVTRLDGTIETGQIGLEIYQGDVIETNGDGAVNIVFADDTSFAISEDARLAIDEYVFDPSTNTGQTDFSVLNGVFVFTSGLIGREDPDDVNIETPVGSIGIRGTIIAGDVDQGEITVVEGAIVLRDFSGNEMTLATQFETAKFMPGGGEIQHMGQLAANDVGQKFGAVSGVSPTLFSSINDAAKETQQQNDSSDANKETSPQDTQAQDGAVDGTEGEDAQSPTDKPAAEQAPQQDTQAPPEPMKMNMQKASMTTDTGLNTGPGPGMGGGMQKAVMTARAPGAGKTTETLANTANTNTNNTTTATSNPTATTKPPFEARIEFVRDANNDIILAKIIGVGSAFKTAGLIGISNNYFDLININPGLYHLQPKPGANLDDLPSNFIVRYWVEALDGRIFNGSIADPDGFQDDPNAAPVSVDNNPPAFFRSAEMQSWSYEFGKDFSDPDGDTLTFSISAATQAILDDASIVSSYSFNTADGTLDILFTTLTADTTFTIDIIASDGDTQTPENYSFTVFDGAAIGALPINITGVSGIFASTDIESGIEISGFGNTVFFNSSGDDQTDITGQNNTVHLGLGDDAVTLEATSLNNTVLGGDGDDIFTLQSVQNTLHGMEGNDTFTLDISTSTTPLDDLHTLSSGVLINGGNGLDPAAGGMKFYDVLKLTGDGTPTANTEILDFTAINDAFIKNIEEVNTDNGEKNIIKLTKNDVIQMTDDDNTLFLETDSMDVVDVIGGGFTFDAGLSDGAYNAYTSGDVTLYIDVDAAVTGI